jgi:hypothetical protein
MASYKSDYLDNAILNAILNHAGYTFPATLYIALFTARPAADGTGGTEVTIGSHNYARAVVTANTTNFPTATAHTCPNGAAISFNTPSGSWGTVTSFAIMDAATGGNFLYIGDLTTSVAIAASATVEFLAGALVVGEQ